jgi:hypothetical protein
MTCNAVLPTMAVLLACTSAVTHASPQAGYRVLVQGSAMAGAVHHYLEQAPALSPLDILASSVDVGLTSLLTTTLSDGRSLPWWFERRNSPVGYVYLLAPYAAGDARLCEEAGDHPAFRAVAVQQPLAGDDTPSNQAWDYLRALPHNELDKTCFTFGGATSEEGLDILVYKAWDGAL